MLVFSILLSLLVAVVMQAKHYDPDNTELHPPRPRSASLMHATSVERCPSGKKKATLAKRASVDDIAAYSTRAAEPVWLVRFWPDHFSRQLQRLSSKPKNKYMANKY